MSVLAGWAVLLGVLAAWIFTDPTEPVPMGYRGTFYVFSIVLSFFYIADFILVNVVGYLLFRSGLSPSHRRHLVFAGAGLYALSVPAVSLIVGKTPDWEWLGMLVAALAIGFASLTVLVWCDRPRTNWVNPPPGIGRPGDKPD